MNDPIRAIGNITGNEKIDGTIILVTTIAVITATIGVVLYGLLA